MNSKNLFFFSILFIFTFSCRSDIYELYQSQSNINSNLNTPENKSEVILSNAGVSKILNIPNNKNEAYVNSNFHMLLKDDETENKLYIFYINSENSKGKFYNLIIITDKNDNTIYKDIVEYNINKGNTQLYNIKENNTIEKSILSYNCGGTNRGGGGGGGPDIGGTLPNLGSSFPSFSYSPPSYGGGDSSGGGSSCGEYKLSHTVHSNGNVLGHMYINDCGDHHYIPVEPTYGQSINDDKIITNSKIKTLSNPCGGGRNNNIPTIMPTNDYDLFLFNFPKTERDWLYQNTDIAISFYNASIYGELFNAYTQIINAIKSNKITKPFARITVEILAKSGMSWEEFNNIFLTPTLTHVQMRELEKNLRNPNTVKPTAAFINHEKLYRIYNQAKGTDNFKRFLQKFEPKAPVAHLMFDIGTMQNKNSAAETHQPENYWIKIVFNINYKWNEIPNVVISHIFMHEIIHAEIYRYLLSLSSTNGKINREKLKTLLKQKKYAELFNYYVEWDGKMDNWQHHMIADKYVNTIIDFLKEIYGNQYTDTEYKAIVWRGLKDSKAWNNLPDEEKKIYNDTYDNNFELWEK